MCLCLCVCACMLRARVCACVFFVLPHAENRFKTFELNAAVLRRPPRLRAIFATLPPQSSSRPAFPLPRNKCILGFTRQAPLKNSPLPTSTDNKYTSASFPQWPLPPQESQHRAKMRSPSRNQRERGIVLQSNVALATCVVPGASKA